MTKIGLRVILTWLLLSIVHGFQEPRCDLIGYGQPYPTDCQIMIGRRFPIHSIQKRFFGLETSNKPREITKTQFAKRIALPFFGEYETCKMAFLAIRFLNGSVSYDTSSWRDIHGETRRLKSTCVGTDYTVSRGGNLVVGDHARLALIVYARGSYYDEEVQAKLAAGTVVVAEEDDELGLRATTGLVKPNSLSCGGARLALSNSTSCNMTETIVNSAGSKAIGRAYYAYMYPREIRSLMMSATQRLHIGIPDNSASAMMTIICVRV